MSTVMDAIGKTYDDLEKKRRDKRMDLACKVKETVARLVGEPGDGNDVYFDIDMRYDNNEFVGATINIIEDDSLLFTLEAKPALYCAVALFYIHPDHGPSKAIYTRYDLADAIHNFQKPTKTAPNRWRWMGFDELDKLDEAGFEHGKDYHVVKADTDGSILVHLEIWD